MALNIDGITIPDAQLIGKITSGCELPREAEAA
jgi:hypothetical protein